MLLVGLTGGIGSGKSEVSRRFAALGAVIVDADRVAREVVEPGTDGLAQVASAFGAEMVTPDGSLDRAALGARVFGDEEALARLNAIMHPLIRTRSQELVDAAAQRDPHAIVIHDVALLVEAKLLDRYDVVVVVATDPQTQLRRLVEQRGMSATDAQARIASQAPLADKLAIADYVIRNDGDLAGLQEQVEQVWSALVARAGRTMPA